MEGEQEGEKEGGGRRGSEDWRRGRGRRGRRGAPEPLLKRGPLEAET